MNIKEALKILKREGYRIEKAGDKYIDLPESGRKQYEYSARQIIKWARIYTSADKRRTSLKGTLKYYHKRKNRRISKNKINHKKYDDLSSNKEVYKENIRNWD